MTEDEWLAVESPLGLDYEVLKGIPDRKFWLFGLACCETVWPFLDDDARAAADLVRRVADGRLGYLDGEWNYDEVTRAETVIRQRIEEGQTGANSVVVWALDSGYVAGQKAGMCSLNASEVCGLPMSHYARLLRCIVGNPFRPVALETNRRTEKVVALAESIYAERAFERLPVLAEAFEHDGYRESSLLAHLREDGPHGRGCWPVDLVLGRHESGRYISRFPTRS